jgi:hypothetical protein
MEKTQDIGSQINGVEKYKIIIGKKKIKHGENFGKRNS